ncbi:MAG: DNA mismatch repair endonuclease MutL [Fuerstiella sp.]|nr:DNA mismatch repair endonuclease MutL [Fuerstiella sp.]MDG2129271.1 DNA mismatch repair endonuclease MutL [Fuerstiella sp.]
MSHIQQLDPHVINRIAAGEVIERPASVVKELLENSIDALATRIEIDIVTGGTELIRVTDNGEGMYPEDLELAVTSHATSKICSDEDLQQIATLGFRGEAMASIASISRFRIRTRRTDHSTGRELQSQGGQISIHRDCGCPAGTVIEVHNLFFNTPARRKFLKKPSTEFGRISEQFAKIALANPNLHLVLRHNDKLVYELPATPNQLERIRRFFGSDVGDKLIAVESRTETSDGQYVRLWGYVGEPSLSKGTRKDQYLFLNGRSIQDRSLQHALSEAYRGLLMVGRHPVSFLFLEVPPNLVDVNVHPTKTEVRFQDSQSLYRQLLHTLRDKFLSLDFQAEIVVPSAQRNTATEQPQKELDIWSASAASGLSPPVIGRSDDGAATTFSGTPTVPGFESYRPNLKSAAFRPAVAAAMSPLVEVSAASDSSESSADTQVQEDFSGDQLIVTEGESDLAAATDEPAPSSGTVHGDDYRAFQIHDCYLVVARDEGLEVIDQHALHERILYEYLRHRVLEGKAESQKLLIPESIECSAGEAAVLLEYQELLQEIGFGISDFGGTTVLLTSHPVMLPRGSFVRILRDLSGQLEESDGKTSRRDLLDNMMHTMACRAAIKAGQRLAPEEMQELLSQRHLVDDAHHCPHGRPTSLMLSRGTLDKQFGRLG